MLDSDSKPGFFQKVAGRLTAQAKAKPGAASNDKTTPVEVSLQILEDRVLYSASPVPVDLIVQADAIDNVIADASATLFPPAEASFPFYETENVAESSFDEFVGAGNRDTDDPSDHLDSDFFETSSELEALPGLSAADLITATNELVVVDRGVDGYQQLVDDLLTSENNNRKFEIVYLDPRSSGIETLQNELSDRVAAGADPFDAMHVISHGSDGAINLGSDRLDSGNHDQFSESIKSWGAALTIDADLLIYGCDVAESESGKDFIDSLASLTGADVAASDDITGHQSLGGDWDFEYTVGVTESNIAFSQTVQQEWEQALANHTTASENGGQSKAIGVDGAGRSTVVTSTDDGGATEGLDIYMYFRDQFGTETNDIVVNETLAGDQLHASVAVADNGSKAVTWTSVGTTGDRAVFAKFYDGNNSVVRGEFRVDVPGAGVEADDSSIAIDAAGNVVIVWESTEAGVSEILGRRYSVDGSEVGSVFNVSGSGFADFEQSANAFVAMNDSGQFAVVWDTHDGSANDESAIYAKTFNADGTAFSSTQQIEGAVDFQFTQASTDIDSTGNFVVSFTVKDIDAGTDLEVRAESRLFDTSHVASYSDFVEETDGDQFASSVALLDNGNVRISWEGEGVDQSGSDDPQEVYAATVDFATGNVLTTQESLSSSGVAQRFVNRFNASVTTVGNSSFGAVYFNEVFADDVITVTGEPAASNNETPTGSDQTLTLTEDGFRQILASDFGFSDTDGGTFTQVQISRVPQYGRLFLDGTEVSNGQVILPSEITSGELLYVADKDYSGQDTLLFFVNDGADYSDSFSTLTLDVQPVVDGLLTAFGSTYTSINGSVPANISTEGEQNRPKVTALDDGGYVVVWESVDTDLTSDSDGNGNLNDGQQIYLQRFDAGNNKVGSEVLVGGTLEGDQTRPSVITLADGSFVIAATTQNDSGEVDIYAQRFDLAGNVLFADGNIDATGTATITLAEHSQFNQDFVSLTALRDGGFIAAWSTLDTTLESDPSFAAVARIFDADGNAGSEFLLNNADVTPASSGQFTARTAELDSGSIVATWYDNLLERVMYRLLDSTGTPLSEPQPASEGGGSPEFNARVASLGDNGFVVVWRQGAAASDSEIVGRRFDLDGTPASEPTQIISSTETTFDALPELVSLNDGGFIAVWNSINADNHSRGVLGTRFDADFNRVTDSFVVNTPQYGSQASPSATLLSSGELVVAYAGPDGDNNGSTYGNGIYVDKLTPGAVTGEDTPVSLNLLFSNLDVDNSEFADDIQLSGMPAGTRVSDGITTIEITGFSDVAYITGTGMQVENLTVTPPENFYGNIYIGVTFVVRDFNGTTTASGAYETRMMAIQVDPVNDVATYDPIATTVDENGTTNIDLDSFFSPGNDPDNAGINLSVTPTTGYELDPSSPIVESGGNFEWTNTSGAAGTITFDSADAQFNDNPTSGYQGIEAAFDLNGSGGGDLSINGANAVEVWFRPDVALAQQTLLEFGDANAGWGLYLTNGKIELHFRSSGSHADVTPYVLIGGELSSSEFNQVVVSFSTDGALAGDPTQPDVALYLNGERVDLLTDAQFLGNPSLLVGPLSGSLGATNGGFVHATQTTFANFTGSIAGLNVFDQAINEIEVQHRFFDIAHGHQIVQVDGQSVSAGTATTLSSGATVTYNLDGTITYNPNGQFEELDAYDSGNADSYQSDNFDISVSDGQGDTQTLTIQLTVEGENDEPTLTFSLADPAPTTASRAGTVVAIADGADIDINGEAGLTYALTGTVTGAFAIDANSGEISIIDESIYQNPPGGNHEVTVTVTDAGGETFESSYTVPIIAVPSGRVTGTIFEDAVGDGSVSGDSGVDGVTVYLYRNNGDALRDSNDTLVATTITTGGGNYVFQGPTITYDDYFVVVNSTDITPSNGFNGSFGINDVWAEQTYASAGGLYLDGAGVETVSAGGALFGGYSGTRSDDASTLAGAEHVSQVTVSGLSDGAADFGFSFNVVTNTLAGDDQDDDAGSAQRSVQGSLRQFIHNANAIDNSDGADVDNAMRFVARNGANSTDSTWWSVVVSEALPAILDSNTTIDGTVYSADGSGVLDLRAGLSGAIATVGANDSHSLAGFDQPEFEIVADQTVAAGDRIQNGLVFAANADQTTLSNIAIRNLSIHGFGSTTGDNANVFLAGGGIDNASAYTIDGVLIENTFVGIAPDESHGTVFRSQGIMVYRANNGVIQDSLIGHQGLSGIHFRTNAADGGASVATGWQILRNEVINNGSSDNQYGGIGLGNSSGTLVRHNLIADNAGFGIDSYFAPGGFTISQNTITRNGLGGFDQGGIRLFGSNSVVSQNRIVDNAGTGITVLGTTERGSFFTFAGTSNELTQNQFGGNTGIDIDLVASLAGGQSFSDLAVDGTPVAGLDTNGNNSLNATEIAATSLSLAADDTDSSGSISRSEYNSAQARHTGQGDGSSTIDGFNQHSGNHGLDQPELVSASLYPDRVELAFNIASGVDRVELYDVTVVGPDERVTYITSLLVSNMTFDSASGTYRIGINPPPPVSGQLTAVAFDSTNTSEFGNRQNLNAVPTGQSNSISTLEDTPRSLAQADFGFTDAEDQADISRGTINISSISGGTVTLSGANVSTPATLSRADLDNLVFHPTPDSNAAGSIEFDVTDSDGATNGTTYTLTINVTPDNDLPTAQNNTVTTLEDTARSLEQADFGFTDVEDQADVSRGTINISAISGGTVTLSGANVATPATLSRTDLDNLVFHPTPDSNVAGSIEFDVTDSDGATNGTTYNLTINITPENDIPSAENNSVTTQEDTPRALAQADFGFSDIEDQSDVSLGTINISSISGGSLQLSGSNLALPNTLSRSDLDDLVFHPTPESSGTETIEFQVFDSNAATDGTTYTLTVNVTSSNDLPTAQSNTISTLEDTPRPLGQADFAFTDVEDQSDVSKGTINISSIGGGTLELSGITILLPATLSRTALDNLVFHPTENSNAPGLIDFAVFDSEGATNGVTYTLTINVTPQNDEPTISSPPTFTLQEDTPRVITNFGAILESTGSDPDGDPFNGLQIATSDFDPGVFVYDSILDILTVNPPADATGTVELDYTLQFGSDFVSDSVTFFVTPENDAPRTQDDEIRIAEDASLNLSSRFAAMLSNDSDPEGDPLSVVAGSFSSPIHGTLDVDATSGDLIYLPNSDSAHTETLTYEVSDGMTSSTSTLNIIVEARNDAPVLTAPATVSIAENSRTVGSPTATDTEDGSASWAIVGGADAEYFVNDGGTLRFVGTPDFENTQDRSGNNIYRVRLAAVDSEGLQSNNQLIQVRVTDLNEAPVALTPLANATVFGSGSQAVGSVNLNDLTRDFDAGDSISFAVQKQSARGIITISPEGKFFYEATSASPDNRDSFQFVGIDSQGLQSDIITVQLNLLNATVASTTNESDEETEDTTDNNDRNDEANEEADGPSNASVVVDQDQNSSDEVSQDGVPPIATASAGAGAFTDDAIEFNGFDSDETSEFESDNISSQSGRTYSYALNIDETQLVNSFSLDRNYRRSVRTAQFDVDVLASAFMEELDSSKQQYLHNRLAVGAPEVAASAATLLTMSYLVWNMASGILLSTFMSSLPAWTSFDVLPVIASSAISSDDGESIEQMVDA